MNVHEARGHEQAAGVKRLSGIALDRPYGCNTAVFDGDIGLAGGTAQSIMNSAVADDEVVAGHGSISWMVWHYRIGLILGLMRLGLMSLGLMLSAPILSGLPSGVMGQAVSARRGQP
ncbi:MAG: hypothetical protein ACK51Y_01865, partial [Burkholderiales bacterium]